MAAAATTIIIPTIGTPLLDRSVRSALNQTVPCTVLVVVDGIQYVENVRKMLPQKAMREGRLHVLELPWNVGGGNPKLLGHPMYGALPMFVKTDFVAFLDEDNWFDPEHIESLESACRKDNLDWAFSLRKIWCDGVFRCVDNCENLGNIRKTWEDVDFLVDTSCFLLRSHVARDIGPAWYHPHADRPVTARLMKGNPNFKSTYKATLNYDFQVDNVRGQKVVFFDVGNCLLKYDFENKPLVYVAHVDKADTTKVLQDLDSSIYACLAKRANILNAYECKSHIPKGATLLVNFCNRAGLDMEMLRRTDIDKVLLIREPPMLHNVLNWDIGFMHMFKKVITCWKPMQKVVEYAKHLNVYDGTAAETFTVNPNRKVCILIEDKRPEKSKEFVVNNVKLVARDLSDVAKVVKELGQDVPVLRKDCTDEQLKEFTFCIVQNPVDAEGFVCEAFFRCLSLGVIPIYLDGNRHEWIPQNCYIDPYKIGSNLKDYLGTADTSSFLRDRNAVLRTSTPEVLADTVLLG